MINTSDSLIEEALGLRCKYSITSDPSAPLFLLVHGRAGNFDVMWSFRKLIPDDCNIIVPQAFLADPIGGFSWWEVLGNGKSLGFESIETAYQKLRTFNENARSHFGLTPRSVVAFGFSQGAALLSLYLQREPGTFKGVALLAGLVIEDSSSQPPDLDKLNIIMAHGEKDEIIPVSKARAGYQYLQSRGANVEFTSDEVGHKVGSQSMRRLKEWVPTTISKG